MPSVLSATFHNTDLSRYESDTFYFVLKVVAEALQVLPLLLKVDLSNCPFTSKDKGKDKPKCLRHRHLSPPLRIRLHIVSSPMVIHE